MAKRNQSELLRRQAETDLQRVLNRLTPGLRARVGAALRQYGGVDSIPAQFWVELQADIDKEAAEAILIMMVAFYRDTQDFLGLDATHEEAIAVSAAKAAVRVSERTTGDWLAGVRRRLEGADATGMTDREVRVVVRTATEDWSAETAARNGSVRARTAARRAAGSDSGREFDLIWRNHPELSVSGPCPYCSELEGMAEFEDELGGGGWSEAAPDGPPAHPNCVCDLETVYRQESADEDVDESA